jgi:predicted nucleic-acid-binding protein
VLGLDTNVLCRYLLADDPDQTRIATARIERSISSGVPCYLSKIVLCELVWVLESCAPVPKAAIVRMLESVLETRGLEVEDRAQVRTALARYEDKEGDFADYLIGECNAVDGCDRTITFDRALQDAPGFELP